MIETVRTLMEKVEFDHPFRVVFPDGSEINRGDKPEFVMRIKTERALAEMLRHPSLGFGESFMRGEIGVEGHFQRCLEYGFVLQSTKVAKPTVWQTIKLMLGYWSRRNTLEGSQKNIAAHYDLGNEFYSLWLDRDHKQYTCAYFETRKDTIEQAQRQKLDLVCRKLRLQPGETVVEAGCGWGGFALHAAKNYGVRIRSYNISKEQVQYAQEKARKEGIGKDRLEYVLDDYRNIGASGETYDKFVSIGMLEHVGVENYRNLYNIIAKVVKKNGLALVHSIGREAPKPMDAWLEKYIFPGAYIPSLSEMVTPVEESNRPVFVQDVENLRFHYALTLDQWRDRLLSNEAKIVSMYDESFFRMFWLYLEASAAGFRYGGIQLYQILVSNGYDNEAPLTRKHFFEATRVSQNGHSRKKASDGANGSRSNGRATRASANGNGSSKRKKVARSR